MSNLSQFSPYFSSASTIPVANGGTGATTLTANNVILGNGTSAPLFVAPGTNGNVLTSNGTTWTSAAAASGTVTSVSGTGTVNGISLSGTVTSSGSLTLGGTLSGVNLTSQVTGTLPVANGGTGVTTSTGSGSIVLSTSPVLVTPNLGTPSAVTLTSATGLPLTTGVTGTLPVANGGTGAATLTGVVIGSGTSAFTVKTNPSGDFVGTTDTQTLTNKTLTAPTITGAVLNDGYTEEVFTITDGGTVNLDPNNGSIQLWTLGANRTPGQANWAAGQSITLMVDDGSAYSITWSTLSVVWKTNTGTAPTLNTTGYTVIALWKVGTTIYGARVGDA